jgi:hypothetical protein
MAINRTQDGLHPTAAVKSMSLAIETILLAGSRNRIKRLAELLRLCGGPVHQFCEKFVVKEEPGLHMLNASWTHEYMGLPESGVETGQISELHWRLTSGLHNHYKLPPFPHRQSSHYIANEHSF